VTDENRRQNVTEEVGRGNEALAEAKHLLAGGFCNGAVCRAYYAAYHWARALLLTRGIEARTHRGTVQLLGLHFVKDGPLPEAAASDLAQLENYRELSDYTASAQFSTEQASAQIARAEAFIGACRTLLSGGASNAPQ